MNIIIPSLLVLSLLLVLWWIVKLIWLKPVSINHFYERTMFRFVLRSPELLTQLGILERFGLHFHNDDLTNESDEFHKSLLKFAEDSLRMLRSYPRTKQTPQQLLSTDVLDWFLEDMVLGKPFLHHNYPLNQCFGKQSELPNFMVSLHPLNNKRDAKNYIKRLSKFDLKFGQILDGLKIRERKGILPPSFVIQRVLKEMRDFISVPVRENILFTAFQEKLAKLNLKPQELEAISALVAMEIEATVYPSYSQLIQYYAALEPHATSEDGTWKLPQGESYYAYRLRTHTTTDMDPEEVHQLGLEEVMRIEVEMRRLLNDQGYIGKSIVEHMKDLSQDPRFLYPNTDTGRAQVLEDYRAIVHDVEGHLENLFDQRPKAGLNVERMPSFQEETTPEAYYMPSSLDGSRPGVFYVNLRNLTEIRKFAMRTLAYHEAIPGHHFQFALAQELRGVPTFRRVVPFTAYVEGWALYAERLAYEHQFFDDPYSQLGYLESELFRAVRLVVDTGIHDQRWTREQAITYMESHIGQPQESIVTEVERYIVMPAQACAYKIGELKLVELRKKVKTALGDKFDLKAYHNIVLQDGSMPLSILEDRIEAYIQETSSAPKQASI